MGLSHALANAYTGLSVSSRRAQLTAHNVANAATPGFARRSVEVSASVVDNVGQGVKIDSTRLAEAPGITIERRLADSELGFQDSVAGAASAMAELVGDPDDPGSLFITIEELESSLSALSETPDATHLQSTVLSRASDVAAKMNDLNRGVLDLRENVDQEIERQIEILNETLVEFDKVNRDVERISNRGGDPTEIIAERNLLIDKISSFVPVRTQDRAGERIALVTQSGFTLSDSFPAQIEFNAANVISSDMDYLGGTPGALDGLTFDGQDLTPPNATGNPFGGGSIAGLFEVRDVTTLEFQSSIDAFSRDLVDRFTTAEQGAFPAATVGLFTDNQGVDSGVAGLAGRLEVNNAVDPSQGGELWRLRDGVSATVEGVAGDNTQLVRMIDGMTTSSAAPTGSGVSGSHNTSNLAAAIATKFDTISVSADQKLTMRASRQETLANAEAAEIGVDIDYELQNLNLIQTAYAANARVMEVVDLMLRRLMEI